MKVFDVDLLACDRHLGHLKAGPLPTWTDLHGTDPVPKEALAPAGFVMRRIDVTS